MRPAGTALGISARRRGPRRSGPTWPRARRERPGRRRAREPALLPYLPAVCERLLGEQLRLPSVPSWWLGDPDSRAEVLPRLSAGDPTLEVRHIDDPRRRLGTADAELLARVDREPHRFAAVEQLPLSQVPVWDAGGAASALPVTLRGFAIRFGSTYRPLVGGLATVRSAQDGAPRTKDVWVLKSDEAEADQGSSTWRPSHDPERPDPRAARPVGPLLDRQIRRTRRGPAAPRDRDASGARPAGSAPGDQCG